MDRAEKQAIWEKIESLAKENTKFPNGDKVYMKKDNGGTPCAAFRTHLAGWDKARTFALKHNSQTDAFEYASEFLESHRIAI